MENEVNDSRISKYFDLPQLRQAARNTYFKELDKEYKPTLPIHNKNYIFGIEVEVERVPNPRIDGTTYWTMTADGSLRNDGVEFVSLPIRMDQIEGALKQLRANLPNTHEFSPRTSVHVHMNVRDMTITKINNLVLLYTMVENLLFNYAGESRKNNVFCIRLQDTNYVRLMRDFQTNPYEVVHTWNKYTALNLNPMQDKGTVEFRHMRGTVDTTTLITWINFLACLKTYAKENTTAQLLRQVVELNAQSNYEIFLYNIFGEAAEILIHRQDVQHSMEEAVSFVKLANWSPEKQPEQEKQKYVNTTMTFMDEIVVDTPRPFARDVDRIRRILRQEQQAMTLGGNTTPITNTGI